MENKEVFIDIPERFFSDVTDKPFESCDICGKFLLDTNVPYVIEKVVKNYEGHNFSSTVYEFMQKSMSDESLQSLQNHYSKVMATKGNNPLMIDLRTFNMDNWLSKCFFDGGEISSMNEYQIVGQFKGSQLVLNTPPLIIGEKAMREMAKIISEKTTDEMNGFRDKFLGPSPEMEELINGKKLILL